MSRILWALALLLLPAALPQPPEPIRERNERYGADLEQHFRRLLVDEYPERAGRLWSRAYTSIDAFLRSV